MLLRNLFSFLCVFVVPKEKSHPCIYFHCCISDFGPCCSVIPKQTGMTATTSLQPFVDSQVQRGLVKIRILENNELFHCKQKKFLFPKELRLPEFSNYYFSCNSF